MRFSNRNRNQNFPNHVFAEILDKSKEKNQKFVRLKGQVSEKQQDIEQITNVELESMIFIERVLVKRLQKDDVRVLVISCYVLRNTYFAKVVII